MFLVDGKQLRALAASVSAIAGLALTSHAVAQSVVVRSTGPSAQTYPQGRKLPAGTSVTLKAGDHVTVLDKAGTRVLNGPGTFALNGEVNRDAGGGAQLATMMARTGGSRTRTGAVRGAVSGPVMSAPTGPENIWYIDVSKGGTYCVADPATVLLWRPEKTEEGTGKLLSQDGSSADVTWRAGSALKVWPAASVPVVDGQTYTFSNAVGMPVKIRTMVLAQVPSDELEVAGVIADKGCTAQLDMLANLAQSSQVGG
ncbi:hypothetical protein [Novosphingobium jiangmenense]|uniref:Uncharacterized protein n=1 Tax=Novosphingobium jiangmenense TaxID=2791981 RepID=A0ABS0HHP6_9SPHN|nr:hypothetical protein [Novosphingobium jiangmenense]MBF9151778.1 hypothetical protein [Novosphingobium jiangmenense]